MPITATKVGAGFLNDPTTYVLDGTAGSTLTILSVDSTAGAASAVVTSSVLSATTIAFVQEQVRQVAAASPVGSAVASIASTVLNIFNLQSLDASLAPATLSTALVANITTLTANSVANTLSALQLAYSGSAGSKSVGSQILPGASGNVLTSDGVKWTSSTPASGLTQPQVLTRQSFGSF